MHPSNRTRIPRGGAVQPGYLYITRRHDHEFLEHAMQPGCFSISACRTSGKTSLVLRSREVLAQQGVVLAYVDVAGLGKPNNIDKWIQDFQEQILVDLEMDLPANSSRTSAKSPHVRMREFIQHLSTAKMSRILFALDEIDWIELLDYSDELIAMFRSLRAWIADARSGFPPTIVFVGLRTLHELGDAKYGTASPIGRTLWLEDFPHRQEIAHHIATVLFQASDSSEEISSYLLEQTGGQPFLTMILADEISNRKLETLTEVREWLQVYLEEQRNESTELFSNIEQFFYTPRANTQEALSIYEDLLDGKSVARAPDMPGARFLRYAGLVRKGATGIDIKGPLFKNYFDKQWVVRIREKIERQRATRWSSRSGQKQRPRIFIFNTGGTIGMVRRGNKVVPPEDREEFLRLYSVIEGVAEIEFEQPFIRDSINVVPDDWARLAREIYRRRHDGYAGFIIAHGTDTMAFTASAVAFALGPKLWFPVVFTGAQTTADILHGDAQPNLLRACLVATQKIPEVVICFGNYAFRAVRAQKRDERRFDGFESTTYPALAEITEIIEPLPGHNSNIRVATGDIRKMPEGSGLDIDLRAKFASGVLMIQLTPGLEPEFYQQALHQLDEDTGMRRCRGVIIQTLGAGNVTSVEPYHFNEFIATALEREIPVLITSPYPWRPSRASEFAPAAAPISMGAIPGGEMTAAAAVTKFRWALAWVDAAVESGEIKSTDRMAEVKRIMSKNYVGELSDRDTVEEPQNQ